MEQQRRDREGERDAKEGKEGSHTAWRAAAVLLLLLKAAFFRGKEKTQRGTGAGGVGGEGAGRGETERGKNPRNAPREHFEIGWQWFKITPSKVPRRPLESHSSLQAPESLCGQLDEMERDPDCLRRATSKRISFSRRLTSLALLN